VQYDDEDLAFLAKKKEVSSCCGEYAHSPTSYSAPATWLGDDAVTASQSKSQRACISNNRKPILANSVCMRGQRQVII